MRYSLYLIACFIPRFAQGGTSAKVERIPKEKSKEAATSHKDEQAPVKIENSVARLNTTLLERYINDVIGCAKVPAFAITVRQKAAVGDEVLRYDRGFGQLDPACDRKSQKCAPVTPDSIFGVGSLSKQFSFILLARLLLKSEKYNTSLFQTPLTSILDPTEVGFFPDQPCLRQLVTLQDLLSHKVGAGKNILPLLLTPRKNRSEMWRYLTHIPIQKPYHAAYRNFNYNNFMFSVLGRVVEVLSGLAFEEAMQKYVFDPLHLSSAGYVYNMLDNKNLVRSYWQANYDGRIETLDKEIGHTNLKQVAPAGGVALSMKDMGKFLEALFLSKNHPVVPEVVQRSLLKRQAAFSPGTLTVALADQAKSGKKLFQIGIYNTALIEGTYNGYRFHYHGAESGCYSGATHYFEHAGLVISCLQSSPLHLGYRICDRIAFRAFDDTLQLLHSPADEPQIKCEDQPTMPPPSQFNGVDCEIDQLTGNRFPGIYKNPVFGDFIIKFDQSQARLTWHYGTDGIGQICRPKSMETTQKNAAVLQLTGMAPDFDKLKFNATVAEAYKNGLLFEVTIPEKFAGPFSMGRPPPLIFDVKGTKVVGIHMMSFDPIAPPYYRKVE